MNRLFFLDHSPIDFYFKQTPETFVVEEIPLYEFSGDGEHLILKVRKKNLTTWQMLQSFSEQIGIKIRDIGYAGLKDKNALTYQYISINKKYEDRLKNFSHLNIKIIEIKKHKNKIRTGHLKGNRFFIRLKKVDLLSAKKIENVLKVIQKEGMPNYFGYQRFGVDEKNFLLGKELIKKSKLHKKDKFLINAYQSYLFNLWLSKRVEISKMINSFEKKELKNLLDFPSGIIDELKKQKPFFKLFPGDIASHYPFGKLFEVDDVLSESKRFEKRLISPTGLLPGSKVKRSSGLARDIEKDFDEEIKLFGDRRFAWVFPENIEFIYKEDRAWMEINFFLPKGSYATVLLEEIAHRKIKEKIT